MRKHFLIILLFISKFAFPQSSLVIQDTRNISTSPDSYTTTFEGHFKYGRYIGLSEYGMNPYYTILGLRGWTSDNSGGKAHELAFSNDNQIYFRSGYSPSWESWKKVVIAEANGNVGIGTNTPNSKLSLKGLSENDLDSVGIRLNNNWSANGNFFISSYVNLNTSDNNLRIGENAETFVTIISDSPQGGLTRGNVGIGTTIPDEKLTVKGKIHAQEVKVDLIVPGPDYVFNQDYKLTPLSEIKSFVKANKHLPEVPSAKQMEANGINLSEMNMLLLKKVEELTLHLIEQDKVNKEQNEKIITLEKLIRIK